MAKQGPFQFLKYPIPYLKTHSEIQKLTDMKPNFDDEQITMDGKTLRLILQKTAKFGIYNYLSLQNDCHQNIVIDCNIARCL